MHLPKNVQHDPSKGGEEAQNCDKRDQLFDGSGVA